MRYFVTALFAFLAAVAISHPGNVDANGGHRDRKTGQYHYHSSRTPSKPPSSSPSASPSASGRQATAVTPTTTAGAVERSATVTRVVDGDTLVLSTGEKVRLIGVDTPESVDPRRPVEYFGKEASAYTKRLAEGKLVRLQFGDDSKDRYGRTLAYVFLPDGTMLNARLIQDGYANAYTRFPFKYMEQFRALEREARAARRGLWADPAPVPGAGR